MQVLGNVNVLPAYSVHNCDDFLTDIRRTTYCSEHLNQCSFIDHMSCLIVKDR